MIEGNFLKDVMITQFGNDYTPKTYIYGESANIIENKWVIEKAIIIENNVRIVEDNFLVETNFNSEKINTLFSNLTSLGVSGLQATTASKDDIIITFFILIYTYKFDFKN